MVVNWREKKECGHDAKEGTDIDSVHSAVPLKSVGLNLLIPKKSLLNKCSLSAKRFENGAPAVMLVNSENLL